MQAPARIRRLLRCGLTAVLVLLALGAPFGPAAGLAPALHAAGPVYYDRVLETTTVSSTTTPLTLLGAVSGNQTFAVVGNGNTCYYYIEAVDANGVPTGEWEIGLGTYTSSGTTLSRATILASSNSGSIVNFAAGTKRVGLTQPAAAIRGVQFSAYKSSNQTGIAINTATKVTFTGEAFDTANAFASSTFTAPLAGGYHFDACVYFSTAATGATAMMLYVNGTLFKDPLLGTALTPGAANAGWTVRLNVGDTVEIYIQSQTASDVNLTGDASGLYTYFMGHFLGS